MPFLRSLKETAPETDPDLDWPIDGLIYVIAFMGPPSAGSAIGALVHDWKTALLGLLMGIGITCLNGWLCDRFFDRRIARYQGQLQRGTPRVLVNIVAFAWAIALCALAMLAPFVVLGNAPLAHIR